ncbi:hypothetical protein HR51_32605 [Burkholderia cepacia]|nr:hypothetical protein HR51_32605 [Burkholderia cepacia]
MSLSRIPSHPNPAALDEQARIADAQHAPHLHHARRKARQYRHSTFRHGTRTKTVHGAAKAQHLLARMSASGVTHRRVAALHRDPDGRRGRDGNAHQQGKQQQGRDKERRQQQGREQQQQQQQQQQRRPRQRDGRPGPPPRATQERDAITVRRRGSVSDAHAPGGADPVSDATRTAMHAPEAAALDLPLLRDDAMRAAWTDRFFSIGERLRQGKASQPARMALSTTLELLRTRRGANFLAGSFDDNLASVRQDLIDSQARLRDARPVARPGDRQASFNALLPLMVLSARRPLSGTLADRSMRHVEVMLRTPARPVPGSTSDPT